MYEYLWSRKRLQIIERVERSVTFMGLNAIERDEERKKYNNIITILDGYLLNAI